jgi:hypothetical protein
MVDFCGQCPPYGWMEIVGWALPTFLPGCEMEF